MKVSELSDRLAKRDRKLSRRQGTLIVDEGGSLCGIITRGDVLRAIDHPREVLAYLGRAAVMTARLHRMKEEQEREPGLVAGTGVTCSANC